MTRLAVPEPEWLITEPFWDAFGVEVRQDEAPDDGGTAMATFHQDGTRWWVVTLPWRDPPPDIPAENYSPSLMSLSPNGRYCAALVLERAGWSGPQLQAHLLAAAVPVIGRVRGARVLLDVRTLVAGSHGAGPAALAAELAASMRASAA